MEVQRKITGKSAKKMGKRYSMQKKGKAECHITMKIR